MLNTAIKNSIDQCVLCWLATADANGQPNVSPKEMFTYTDDGYLVIANIASPNSIKNIRQQPQVSVSFVDIFVQKGFQLKGTARIIKANEADFAAKAKKLKLMAGELFPFKMLIAIKVDSVKEIVAPRYRLFPNTTEAEQIESAMRTYGVQQRE
ncbi:MAG: pyridoxamine 5'-phosphate oxidase family protein [Saprospiraceae bacterium]